MKALSVALAFCAFGSVSASVRTEIEGQYHRWAKATLKNDVETVLSVLTPDYSLQTFTGAIIDRKTYEASLRKRRATKQAATVYQTRMEQIQISGTTARVISDETSSKAAVDPITSKKLKMVHIHRYLDTWVKIGGSWRLKKTVTQVESTKVLPA